MDSCTPRWQELGLGTVPSTVYGRIVTADVRLRGSRTPYRAGIFFQCLRDGTASFTAVNWFTAVLGSTPSFSCGEG
ncbi:hypothetical protein BD779DRAFT_323804 [Infundibulicybe gibba]|nr:hypothetical protein BD779DRAFT_323804 [Infundibulicybe gibba]